MIDGYQPLDRPDGGIDPDSDTGAVRLFGADAITIEYPKMVERLDAHPEITGMNLHVEQKKLEEG